MQNRGSYTATLQVTNAAGMGEVSKALEVRVKENPESDFNYTIHPDGKVEFQNLSTNADTYGWYFATPTPVRRPIRCISTISRPGYLVLLVSSNYCGSSLKEKIVDIGSITGTHTDNDWLESFRLYPNPNFGEFTME
jgi:hypothetical protein